MMLRIENGKRLKKDVKIQFRERCLETYRTYRKFNTIQKTFANRLYVNSTSIRSKFISSAEIQSREKRRTNKTRNWYLFRRSRSDKLSRVILILTFSLTLSHSHTLLICTLMFSQKSREYFLPYRSADRTIRRRSDRNYAVCVAREGGGREGYRVLAWENDTFTRGVYPARSSNRRQANVSISRVRGHCSFNAPQDTYCEPRGREKGGRKGSVSWAPLCDVNSPRVSAPGWAGRRGGEGRGRWISPQSRRHIFIGRLYS